MTKVVKYKDIAPSLKLGDIVLFKGKGIMSAIIRLFTRSPYTHVGMVVSDNKFGHGKKYLWESTTLSNLPDLLSGKPKRGVQLVDLEERVNTYKGEVYIRKLPIHRNENFHAIFGQLQNYLKDRDYEGSIRQLAKSTLDLTPLGRNKKDLSTIFCSELVAEHYISWGLLPKYPPSNEYTPKDFAKMSRALTYKGHKIFLENLIKVIPGV